MNFETELLFEGGTLRVLIPEDVYAGYVSGLNDPEVNRYLEIAKRSPETLESVVDFVRSNLDCASGVLWGIWLDEASHHCGTVRVHGIESYNRTAHIGICLFDKSAWGKRIGTKAIATVTRWALQEHNLRWIEAGAYEQNIPSQKAFLAAGYDWVFDIPGKYLFEGKPANVKVFAARSATH
jgi:ribosomal-protein-alanine N-acetyltransferase